MSQFDALIDWNLWGNLDASNLRMREVGTRLDDINRPGIVTVIKGIRRAGKTSLAYLFAKKFKPEDTLFINFEDPRINIKTSSDIFNLIKEYNTNVNQNGPKLLILDEVQNIPGWERFTRAFVDKNNRIIVTGSSSKLMSEEYSSLLTGRHVDIEVFGLSFKEACQWAGIKINPLEILKNKKHILFTLNRYLNEGNFPKIFLENSEVLKKELSKNIFNDILVKDIAKRNSIKDFGKLQELAELYLTNISTLQSFNKLKNMLHLSRDTIKRYSEYMNTARLFFYVRKFSYSLREQLQNPRKIYAADTGLHTQLAFKFSDNQGRVLENLVAMELFREGKEIYYWKNRQHEEIDFVIKNNKKIEQLIQVSYDISDEKTLNREVRILIKASKELNCQNLMILTWDEEYEITKDNKKIKIIPLWKWLLLQK